VPVGACVVVPSLSPSSADLVVARANAQERLRDPLAHAEARALGAAMRARRRAAETAGGPAAAAATRLEGSTLYVTVEPCLFCLGACLLHRVRRVVYGCAGPKFGAFTCMNAHPLPSTLHSGQFLWPPPSASLHSGQFLWPPPSAERAPHRVLVQGGMCEQECADLMKDFFRARRSNGSLFSE
jgi:tRNA(adenine34) deaminase